MESEQIMKVTRQPGTWLYPVPPVLVSCQNGGSANIITLAWAGVACSDPVIISLGIRPERYSYAIIKESGGFVVNMPMASQVAMVDTCGTLSGRDHDKFAVCGFTALPGKFGTAPLIAECPVNIECSVTEIISLGSHHLFLGKVLGIQYDETYAVNGRLDLPATDPMIYGFGNYYRLGELLGRHGESRR